MLCCCLQKHMDNFIVHFYKNNIKNKHTTKATNSWLRTYTLWAEGNNQKELEKYFSYCTLHRAITSTYS